MRSKLSRTTFAAVDESRPGRSSPPSIEDRSVQCSPCQIAAQRMRSSLLRSHRLLGPGKVNYFSSDIEFRQVVTARGDDLQ